MACWQTHRGWSACGEILLGIAVSIKVRVRHVDTWPRRLAPHSPASGPPRGGRGGWGATRLGGLLDSMVPAYSVSYYTEDVHRQQPKCSSVTAQRWPELPYLEDQRPWRLNWTFVDGHFDGHQGRGRRWLAWRQVRNYPKFLETSWSMTALSGNVFGVCVCVCATMACINVCVIVVGQLYSLCVIQECPFVTTNETSKTFSSLTISCDGGMKCVLFSVYGTANNSILPPVCSGNVHNI